MIFIQDPHSKLDSRRKTLLRKAAQATLQQEKSPSETDLTIVIDDDAALKELNQRFRGYDEPTDVLSFPGDETDPETGGRYLGDIVISLQRAQEQAASGGHAVEDELQLLVVHGVLHLLGYDHADEEEKKHMWMAQNQVLSALGNPALVDPDK